MFLCYTFDDDIFDHADDVLFFCFFWHKSEEKLNVAQLIKTNPVSPKSPQDPGCGYVAVDVSWILELSSKTCVTVGVSCK